MNLKTSFKKELEMCQTTRMPRRRCQTDIMKIQLFSNRNSPHLPPPKMKKFPNLRGVADKGPLYIYIKEMVGGHFPQISP